ncbi:hypothetical protein SDC9_209347 [bioreactor metagenome]|uniref:Uncharacterized protein n=1 Tax=bioreactor metagenome TaxID=1076179 RepID=A0A645JG14_9ZZZZ
MALRRGVSSSPMRAKARNWSSRPSISFMCRPICANSAGSSLASEISSARRSLVSGVRRSCETPASITARSRSRAARSSASWLKLAATVAISCGPSSARRGGRSPLPMTWAASTRRASGRLMRREMPTAPKIASSVAAADRPRNSQGATGSNWPPRRVTQ